MNNRSILNGKCPPGWDLVGETCYMYIGAPMTFWEAKAFCQVRKYSFEVENIVLIIGVQVGRHEKLVNIPFHYTLQFRK